MEMGNSLDGDQSVENYFSNLVSDKTLFRTLAKLSDEILFSYDVRTSSIQYYGSVIGKFKTPIIVEEFAYKVVERGNVL